MRFEQGEETVGNMVNNQQGWMGASTKSKECDL
jgi:hypothetical protein